MTSRLMCALGWHRWKPVVRRLSRPEPDYAVIAAIAYLPAFAWLGLPITTNFKRVGHQCVRCRRRK